MQPEYLQAGGTELLVISVLALFFIARLLYKPPKDGIRSEDKPTTLASRGEWVPAIVGTRKVGYMFCWAGDRRAEKRDSGGGKGGSGGGAKTTIYFESGWHVICLGPASRLEAIFQDGEVIWEGPIDSFTTPSGTSFTIPEKGTFTIYWGEKDQPINTFLADPARVGIASRWPYFCYVIWENKELGPSPTWPLMEYAISTTCIGTELQQSTALLDNGTSSGINGAHALFMMLNAKYPHGCGTPNNEIDNDTLESLGVLAQNEHLPVNMVLTGGEPFEKFVQGILLDYGVFMSYAQGRLAFIILRDSDAAEVPVFDNDIIMPPDMERFIDRGDNPASRTVFFFDNEKGLKYRRHDIVYDDSAEAEQTGRFQVVEVPLITPTHPEIAAKIARRRIQENSIPGGIKVLALRGARQLVAGQQFDHSLGRFRVVSKKIFDDSPRVELEVALDSYAVPDIDDVIDDPTGGSGPGANPTPEPDIAFRWLELPPSLSGPSVTIAVLRTRAHQQISGAGVWASADDVSYSLVGSQDYSSPGGVLQESLSDTTNDIIEAGPSFSDSNGDARFILDLSGDTASWQGGRQIALINDEIFFVESVSVVAETAWQASTAYSEGDYVIPDGSSTGLRYRCTSAGTSDASQPTWPSAAGETVNDGTCEWIAEHYAYRMNNMIRARLGTLPQAHNQGDRVFIADVTRLSSLSHPIFDASIGETIYIKSVPSTFGASVDISEISPVSGEILGFAYQTTPLRVDSDGNYRITTLNERRISKA